MPIVVRCDCGQKLRARDEYAGRYARCAKCGGVLFVPGHAPSAARPPDDPDDDEGSGSYGLAAHVPAPPPVEPPKPSTAPPPAPRVAQRAAVESRPRDYLYWLLLLPLLPLVYSLLHGHAEKPVIERLRSALREQRHSHAKPAKTGQPGRPGAAPEAEPDDDVDDLTIMTGDLDSVIDELPGHKLPGAHLPRRTIIHWLYATLSATAFLILVTVIFPPGTANPLSLAAAGIFTATLGILFLLIVQVLAMVTPVFDILRLIRFSYRAALDPNSNIFLSFLGFTFGVGLCEELIKGIPLFFYLRRSGGDDWRGACLWGMASGVGFGVSEGISYSSNFYNGIADGEMYLVRFASCVALHAVWSASLGISWTLHKDRIRESPNGPILFLNLARTIGLPMVLHGAYDTFLKKELNSLALVVAAVSFAWLATLIERTRRSEEAPPAEVDDGEDHDAAAYAHG